MGFRFLTAGKYAGSAPKAKELFFNCSWDLPTTPQHLRTLNFSFYLCTYPTILPVQAFTRFSLFGLSLLLLFCTGCGESTYHLAYEPQYYTGDSLPKNTAEAALWKEEREPGSTEAFWVRLPMEVSEEALQHEPLGLRINSFGAYEVYWNETLLGRNGLPASEGQTEVAGTETAYFLIPPALTEAGQHWLYLRASQAYSPDERGYLVFLGNYFEMVRAPLIRTAFMYIPAGAFLVAALYYFFLFLTNRKSYTVLLFSITCLLFFALILLEYVKFYLSIPYTHFYTRLEIIGFLTLLIAFLVPCYFSLQFSFRWKKPFLLMLFVLLAGIYLLNYFLDGYYDETAQLLAYCMWFASLLITAEATYRKVTGAALVLGGLLLSAFIHSLLYYDISVFISFSILVLCMLYILALRNKEQAKAYENSLLLSARLKNQLLKKNIQPHFLMNTLTSLMDWVEESPREGVRFIESLAGEFEILNQMADATLVPIRQELDLCQRHLDVMGYRKEITYRWKEEGIDPAEEVPPGLFHTLLENGITHSMPQPNGSICFLLRFRKYSGKKQYAFLTHARNRTTTRHKDGTGLAYVRSRLQESYGTRWELQSKAVPEGWKTTITLYSA